MKALQLIQLLLLATFVSSIGTAAKPCSTATHLPVVNICTDETKIQDANSVLIKADDKKNCTCELHLTDQDKDVTVIIQKYGPVASSSPSTYGCGLIVEFEIGETDWNAQCIVDNATISMTITNNHFMKITSFSVNGTLKQNEGYCFEMRKEVNNTTSNQLNLTCGIGSTSTTDTTQSEEKTAKMIQTTNPTTTGTTTKTTMPKTTTVPITTIIVSKTTSTIPVITTTVPMTTTTTVPMTTTTTAPTRTTDFHTNNDDTEVLAVGASLGGLVIIIVVIAVVCIYRRNHSKSAPKPNFKTGLTVNNDDYGLRGNVLYIPADSTPKQTTENWQNTNRISVDVHGNYSSVDLDEIPSVEESTGNYTSIELKKRTQSKSNLNGSKNKKPIIASKPKQKTTIQDVYSVPDKKRVKHVTAPGENGCEYAVVSKTNKSNDDSSEDQISTSNVYAVVEKKKRVSDGKGTNQKRDSFTAENDSETGQS